MNIQKSVCGSRLPFGACQGLRIAVVTIMLAAMSQAWAQSATATEFPSKPVRVIVAVPPGSGADTITRGVALKLTDYWKVNVIVDNRPGAGGVIAMDIAKDAAPDGYTLLSASPGLVSTATLLRKVKYDSVRAFEPVVLISTQPYVVVVNPKLPLNTMAELIAYARKNPGVLNYASSGKGSASHLGTELFKSMAKVDMTHVPYRGLAQAINEMAGGQTQVLFSTVVSALAHIKAGRVRPIAVATLQRMKAFPQLPTISESGVPGYELSSAYALYAPLGTGRAVIGTVNRDVGELLKDPGNKARIESAGAEVADKNSPSEFRKIFLEEAEKWRGLVMNSATMRQDLFGSQ